MSASDDIRAALLERNAAHETEFYVLLTESQALDLASGYVPNAVKAMCTSMLDWQRQDELRAARPVQPRRKARA